MPVHKVHGDEVLAQVTGGDLRKLQSLDPGEVLLRVGVWIPLAAYARWPVMLPWAVRDLACRGSKSRGIPDYWSSPDDRGYVLDENSFIKGTVRSLAIDAPAGSVLSGAKMAGGFVAAHIWREVNRPVLASKIPLLYSFIPNLVWLPGEVAKLTDYEGGPYQRTLQAMSVAIYRDAKVEPHLQSVVDEAWATLPMPDTAPPALDPHAMNWFVPNESFYRIRRQRTDQVIAALETLGAGRPVLRKVISTRYTAGLPIVDASARSELLNWLKRFTS